MTLRISRPPLIRNSFIFGAVALILGSAGCSARTSGTGPESASSESVRAETRFFKKVSAFYCAQYRWPKSWSELREFQASQGSEASFLDEFGAAEIQSPRAIVLTLSYVDKQGVRHKASFIAPPSCRPKSQGEKASNVVAIAGDGVVFTLPERFSLMKAKEIQERWKAPPFPDAAWHREGGVLVAVRFGDLELSNDQVSDALQDMVEAYEAAVPSLVWRSKGVMSISGKTMLRHEFESASSSGTLLNIVYSGSYDGRLFAVTITGPSHVSQELSDVARQTEETLIVR